MNDKEKDKIFIQYLERSLSDQKSIVIEVLKAFKEHNQQHHDQFIAEVKCINNRMARLNNIIKKMSKTKGKK